MTNFEHIFGQTFLDKLSFSSFSVAGRIKLYIKSHAEVGLTSEFGYLKVQ